MVLGVPSCSVLERREFGVRKLVYSARRLHAREPSHGIGRGTSRVRTESAASLT
jgi:hypothetical protein